MLVLVLTRLDSGKTGAALVEFDLRKSLKLNGTKGAQPNRPDFSYRLPEVAFSYLAEASSVNNWDDRATAILAVSKAHIAAPVAKSSTGVFDLPIRINANFCKALNTNVFRAFFLRW